MHVQQTAHAPSRVSLQAHAASDARWGIVDALLALVLLPFGAWFLVIDRLVAGIGWLVDHVPNAARQ